MKHKKEDDHDGDHFHSDGSIVTIYLSIVNTSLRWHEMMMMIMMVTMTIAMTMTVTMTTRAHIIIVVEGVEDIIGEAGEQIDEEPGLEI